MVKSRNNFRLRLQDEHNVMYFTTVLITLLRLQWYCIDRSITLKHFRMSSQSFEVPKSLLDAYANAGPWLPSNIATYLHYLTTSESYTLLLGDTARLFGVPEYPEHSLIFAHKRHKRLFYQLDVTNHVFPLVQR